MDVTHFVGLPSIEVHDCGFWCSVDLVTRSQQSLECGWEEEEREREWWERRELQ